MSAQEATRFSDSLLSLKEFANLFGFPVEAVVDAVETQRQRASGRQAFFTIAELKNRWNCSPAHVYAVLRASGLQVLNIGQGRERSKTLVRVETVQQIEKARMEKIQ
jgi:hypothetical protein